jgi:hypothetical protein
MRIFSTTVIAIAAAMALPAGNAGAQTAGNNLIVFSAAHLDALKGLAPVTVLEQSPDGKTALDANYARTGAIQHGTAGQPLLLPFAEQQQQALRDTFLPFANHSSNGSNLADGLGTALGGAYQSLTGCTSPDDDLNGDAQCPNISVNVAQLMTYTFAVTSDDATASKFLFANATTDGNTAVPDAEMAILKNINGSTDIFGKAYHHEAHMPGVDSYGNSRPFETEMDIIAFTGKDFFGVTSSSLAYLWGNTQNLINSPSYPSGHTTYGYTESLLLALLLPERYPQMIARGAEYGNDRIVMGAHYTMDVIGGRTLALYDIAQLLANKPGYVGVMRGGVTVDDFGKVLSAARADVVEALKAKCGTSIAVCAQNDTSRFADPERDRAFYESTQTYDLPAANPSTAGTTEDVAKLAPEAGYLLTAAFPYLTLERANAILTETEGPGGGFLDNGSAFGVYSRLNLYRAAVKAIAEAPSDSNPH